MMRDNAWLSILGVYKYDSSIFDDLTLPKATELDLTLPYMQDTVTDLSKDTLVFKMLMDLAELPLVYTDPDMLKFMIGRWSSARTPIWRELWKTTLYKYVPIWNKDGVIEETRSLETSGTSSGSMADNTTAAHTVGVQSRKETVTDQDTTEAASGTDSKTTVIDEDTTESVTGEKDTKTVTDQDTTESKTTVTDQDTTESKHTVTDQDTTESKHTVTDQDTSESKHTVTDQDTSKSGSSSGTGSLNRTVAHNVTGFDTDQYAQDTQDVTSESTTTSSTVSETGTNDVDETVTGSGTNDVNETVTGSGTNDIDETVSGTGTNDITETVTGSRTNDVTVIGEEDSSESKTGTRDVQQTESGTWSESKTGTNDVTETETGSSTEQMTGTGSLDRSTSDETSGTEDETIRRVEQGNIGITTTQQMIREQREIVLLDMYQVITDEFKKQFCIMVY